MTRWIRHPATSTSALVLLLSFMPDVRAQTRHRTPDGHPDLQGTWVNNTATPLERTRDFLNKAFFTEAEARDYESRYQIERTAAAANGDSFELEVASDIDTYEPGRVLPDMRTSLITDPADGRVPALTPAGQERNSARAAQTRGRYAENPENFTNAERCLMIGNTAGPPMLPAYYNNTVQIVQTRDYVMIHSEMIHDARIIPLNRQAHLPPQMQQWKGDSIGRWEGDTLVVDTTNFSDKTTFRGSGTRLHIVERFRLGDANTLQYQFTIEDPETFVRPFTAMSAMSRSDDDRMFEWSCHEANHSMELILRGARFSERQK